jgi:hypothetical protein
VHDGRDADAIDHLGSCLLRIVTQQVVLIMVVECRGLHFARFCYVGGGVFLKCDEQPNDCFAVSSSVQAQDQ